MNFHDWLRPNPYPRLSALIEAGGKRAAERADEPYDARKHPGWPEITPEELATYDAAMADWRARLLRRHHPDDADIESEPHLVGRPPGRPFVAGDHVVPKHGYLLDSRSLRIPTGRVLATEAFDDGQLLTLDTSTLPWLSGYFDLAVAAATSRAKPDIP